MLTEFGKVMIFLLLGVVFVLGGFLTNWLVRPKRPNKEKLSTYECGEEPVGSGWMKFNIRFYVVGLIFILFDVELVFMFPWAVVYKQMGMVAMLEMVAFLTILLVGFAYAWAKGDLEWVRPMPVAPRLEDLISYEKPRLKPMAASAMHETVQPTS